MFFAKRRICWFNIKALSTGPKIHWANYYTRSGIANQMQFCKPVFLFETSKTSTPYLDAILQWCSHSDSLNNADILCLLLLLFYFYSLFHYSFNLFSIWRPFSSLHLWPCGISSLWGLQIKVNCWRLHSSLKTETSWEMMSIKALHERNNNLPINTILMHSS